MDLSIVFPMFWGREKKQVVQEGDYFYDHPTPLDDEGTIPALFESLKVLKDQAFDIIAIAGANHPSLADAVEKRAREVLEKWEEMMGIIGEKRADVQTRVFGS
jgi:hypothetical protein